MTRKGLDARAARKETTRQALLQAARALFAEKGYDGVSVTEIGKRAGVSHTLINAYFDGKAGLAYAIVQDLNDGQDAQMAGILAQDAPALERLRGLARTLLAADLEDPAMMRVLQGYAWNWNREEAVRNRAELQTFADGVLRLIAEGRAAGEIPPGWDAQVLCRGLFALYHYALRDAVMHGKTAEAATEELWPQAMALLGLPPPA